MPTLILSGRHSEDSQLLWRAAMEKGWDVERLHGWRVPEHLRTVAEPVLYVEALMAPMVAEELGLELLEPPDSWLADLAEKYRHRSVRLTTLGQAKTLTAPSFVKPPNDKSFTAGVYASSQLPTEFPDDMAVLVADVVRWEREYRCFLLDRSLRTLSVYLRGGELQRATGYSTTDEEATEVRTFVDNVLKDPAVILPTAAVLDVGVIADRGWAVVELNSAWGAGLYGCDPVEVLEVIRHAAQRKRR